MDKKTNRNSSHSAALKSGAKDKQMCENLNFAAKEAFKKLRANIMLALHSSNDNKCKIIGVTSAQPSDGKSTIAVNTAFSIAELGKRTLLIDADMRRPSLHTKLELKQAPGLSHLLNDGNMVSSAIQTYTSSDGNTSFDIIPGGSIPTNPSELLTSNRMDQLIDALAKVYDFIILDLPPVGVVIDAVSVGKNTDGMLVVVRENNCPAHVFDNCMAQLRFADIKVLGFVVNGSTEGVSKKYYHNYSYGKY